MEKPRLQEKFNKEILPELKKQFGYDNNNAVPTLKMIKINVGLGEAITNPSSLDSMFGVVKNISGQNPVITKAKKAISNFKIRQGDKVGVTVTLRRKRMWYFIDTLINIVLPRVRDFRGIPSISFDGRGNYSLGILEYDVFPEVDRNKIDKIRGLGISIVTTARSDEEGRALLRLLGMPFQKEENK